MVTALVSAFFVRWLGFIATSEALPFGAPQWLLYGEDTAGAFSLGSFVETTPAEFDLELSANLRGPVLVTRAFLPDMVEAGAGLGGQVALAQQTNRLESIQAQATAGDKMKVAWGNLKEGLGTALMPVFERVFGFVTSM